MKQPDAHPLPNPLKPATVAECHAVIEALVARMSMLEATVERLTERLHLDSRTSSKPPSSDGPGAGGGEKKGQRAGTGRKRGGQPGHKGHYRQRLAETEVSEVQAHYPPSACTHCGGTVVREEQPRQTHEVWDIELPPPVVVAHQFYAGTCGGCGRRSRAAWPAGVPTGQMGPTLMSLTALLAGEAQLSVRAIQRLYRDLWQVNFSIGALSEVLKPVSASLQAAYETICQAVTGSRVLHGDETWYRHGPERRWGWTVIGAQHTAFRLHPSRAGYVAQSLIGDAADGQVLVTDQYGAYNHWPDEQRQLCWAHLARHWERLARRSGEAGQIGQRLVLAQAAVQRTQHRRGRGEIDAQRYRRRMQRLQQSIQRLLRAGSTCGHTHSENSCQLWLKQFPMLWTFLRYPGIPLTNNLAERTLRPLVYWRERHQAVQSARGQQFLERMLSFIATCRQQQESVWDLLRRTVNAHLARQPPPLLA